MSAKRPSTPYQRVLRSPAVVDRSPLGVFAGSRRLDARTEKIGHSLRPQQLMRQRRNPTDQGQQESEQKPPSNTHGLWTWKDGVPHPTKQPSQEKRPGHQCNHCLSRGKIKIITEYKSQ